MFKGVSFVKILSTFLALLAYCYVSAQPAQDLVNSAVPKPVPASPNVASLGKYGEYEVSLFNGLPEISIPIYNVESGSLSVPITLNYHASGVKPTDVAGWVGMGWSLSTGGQISRAVNGKPDEQHYFSNELIGDLSVCGPSGVGTFYYLRNAARGVSDTEPDVFTYSFSGRRGKFLWTEDNPPYQIPYSPIRITTSGGFDYFDITDENGVKYRFGENGESTDCVESTTATNGGNPAFSAITGWHLGHVTAPNSDDEISFTYQDVGTFYTHDISYSYTIMDQCFSANGGQCPTNSFNATMHNNDSYGTQIGPQTISFDGGKVEFILAATGRSDMPSLRQLDRIEIQRLDGTVVKTIKFVYSYFSAPGSPNAVLKLDAIQFKDAAGSIAERYDFQYHTNSFSWVPGSNSYLNKRDLWGFYNGLPNSDLVLPRTIDYTPTQGNTTSYVSIGQAYFRYVNPTYVKEGVLKKIIFPTGGYTEFDYEPNAYLKDGVVTLAGGLRVERISSSDGEGGIPIVKTYKYGENESGVGRPNFAELQFNYSATRMVVGYCFGVDPGVNYRIRSFFSNSAFATDQFDSSPVSYPYVTEYIGDPTIKTSGKVMYVFDQGSPPGDVNHVVPNSGKYFRNSFFWDRGQLTQKTVYDNENHKLSETVIGYTKYQEGSRFVGIGVHEYYSQLACSGDPNTCTNEASERVYAQSYFFTTYHLNSGAVLPTSTTETTFQSNDVNRFVSNHTVNTFHPVQLQLTKSVKSRSNNPEETVSENRYPFQLSTSVNSSSTGAAQGLYMLNTKHILSLPVESFSYLQNTGGTDQRITSAQVSTYARSDANIDHVVPNEIYFWESESPLALSQYTLMSVNGTNSGVDLDDGLKGRILMDGYDEHGNIIGVIKDDVHAVSYLWGYDGTRPVAEARNAKEKNIFHTSFEDLSSGFVADGKTGTKSVSSGFTQALTGLDPGAYILSYFLKQGSGWVLQRSPVNVGSSGQYTINVSGQVDEIRFHPAEAQMTTYTYDPLKGVTSITDENNRATYYEYDAFMRLKALKDDGGNVIKAYEYNLKNRN